MPEASAVVINLPGYPFDNLTSVGTISALRARSSGSNANGDNIAVDGGVSVGDALGGLYVWNASSVADDDGSATIRPNDKSPGDAGRFILTGISTITRSLGQLEGYGAISGGIADSSLAAGIVEQGADGRIQIAPGRWIVTEDMTFSGFSLQGAGSKSTTIELRNEARLIFDGGAVSYPNHQISIQDLVIETADTYRANPVVAVSFSGRDGASGAFRTLYLRNLTVRGTTASKGFSCAFDLTNCTNLVTDGITVQNATPIVDGSTAFKFGGTDQPIDMHFSNIYAYFCDTAIQGTGAPTGQGFEGAFFDKCFLLFCNEGIVIHSANVHDVVSITNCNINCYRTDIAITNIHNVNIVGNTLYVCAAGPGQPQAVVPSTWSGVQLLNDDAGFTFNANNLISNNRFFGTPVASPPIKTGVSIDGANGASTSTLIDANRFTHVEFPIQLFSGSGGCVVTGANTYDAFTVQINNLGTANNVTWPNTLRTVGVAVASLPADADPGSRALAIDANSTTFYSIVAGGGANVIPVFKDGTGDWRIG